MAQRRQQTTLILGGGVGGLVTANELRKKVPREHRIIIADREGRHVFTPSFLWLIVGRREPEAIVRDLSLLEHKGIEVVRGDVTAIDPAAKTANVGGETIEADYVVVALGADLAPERVPGLAEAGHNLYTLEGATAIRDRRSGLTSGKLVILVAGIPFKCPAAPYEGAMLLEDDLRRRRVDNAISVSVYTPEQGPMGVAGPEMSAAVRGMVEQKGIDYHPQHQVTEVDGGRRLLRFENGIEAQFDFLVYVPPHSAPPVVREADLTNESGWVPVDRHTLETGFANVFAIGDVTTIPLSVGLPLPKAGTFAHGQAKTVAQTIAARVSGRGPEATFNGYGECFIEVGGGKAGVGRGDFYAEPRPSVKLYRPGRIWHLWKVWFERRWLSRWF